MFVVCPNSKCQQYTFQTWLSKAKVARQYTDGRIDYEAGETIETWQLRPASRAKPFPDFIPEPLRNDYKEACSIESLSPKASATLSRRCLQGIIRDFYGISDRTLNREIDALKARVSADLWSAIDSLRHVGNIGAHPEADINLIIDVEPGEAKALIELIELLFRITYLERNRDKEILAETKRIADEKKALKNQPPPGNAEAAP